jgi:Zn-dependent peptidase ImmA (M78 family)
MGTLYKRPLALFFMSVPPDIDSLPEDFRFRTIEGLVPERNRDLIIQIRQAQEWQSIMGDILSEEPELLPPSQLPKLNEEMDPESAGADTRGLLGISYNEQLDWKSREHAFFQWRERIEAEGILVFAMTFSRKICRGFSLVASHGPPVIALASEVEQARVFTMIHELAHLMLGRQGICTELADDSERGRVERFCNRVAAATLMPLDLVMYAISEVGLPSDRSTLSWSVLKPLADRLWVSVPAIALRLEEAGEAPEGLYESVAYQAVTNQLKPSGGGGGGSSSWPGVRVSERGLNFSGVILRAWESGAIPTSDAARAMNMRPAYVPLIGESLTRRRQRLG